MEDNQNIIDYNSHTDLLTTFFAAKKRIKKSETWIKNSAKRTSHQPFKNIS